MMMIALSSYVKATVKVMKWLPRTLMNEAVRIEVSRLLQNADVKGAKALLEHINLKQMRHDFPRPFVNEIKFSGMRVINHREKL